MWKPGYSAPGEETGNAGSYTCQTVPRGSAFSTEHPSSSSACPDPLSIRQEHLQRQVQLEVELLAETLPFLPQASDTTLDPKLRSIIRDVTS